VLNRLIKLGCDEVQEFYVGRPMPAADIRFDADCPTATTRSFRGRHRILIRFDARGTF